MTRLISIFIASALTLAAPASPAADNAQKALIDKAIDAYARKLQSDDEKAKNQLVANHLSDLGRDPLSPVAGNPRGNVTIVEFFDYACPYCKAMEPRLERLLKDDSNVKLVLKEFPILTPQSLPAARASLAARKQGKFEQFHTALIGFKGRLSEEVIFETAKQVGLDVVRLKKDMQAPDVDNEIIATFNLARAIRIFQTPGIIVGDHMLTEPSAQIDFPKVVAAERAKRVHSHYSK